jgi:hypothetical protein
MLQPPGVIVMVWLSFPLHKVSVSLGREPRAPIALRTQSFAPYVFQETAAGFMR